MNLNRAIVAGRLTADPQLRSTTGGQSVGTFSVATSRAWTDKAGAKQETTEFHNIVVWGRQAELCAQYLKKGALVLIEGRLQTQSYEDKNGGPKRYKTEIIAESVQFGPRQDGGGGGSWSGGGASAPAARPAVAGAKSTPQEPEDEPYGNPADIPIINLDEDEAMTSEIPF